MTTKTHGAEAFPPRSAAFSRLERSAPLSAAQRRLWLLHRLEPESPAFNRPMALHLTGPLDRRALTQSLAEIVHRHEALRTIFNDEAGEPFQQIIEPLPLELETIDLNRVPADERHAEARRVAAARAQNVFDLARGPLIRTVLLALAKDEHVLLLLMHHIVFDGWSELVLTRELIKLYEAFRLSKPSPLLALPIQYADFAAQQQRTLVAGLLEKQLRYWKQQLEGTPALTLATDYPRSGASVYEGGRCSALIPLALTDQLKDFARGERATLFMTLLAAFQLLLARYSGHEDIAVGVPIAGRTILATEGLIGCFMNVLVLRADLSGNLSFRDLLARIREAALQAYAHQEMPFEKLVEELRPQRELNRWPLFQAMFHLRNLPQAELATASELRIAPFPFDRASIGGLDISVEISDQRDGLYCALTYAAKLFRADTTERMLAHYQTLLKSIVADPERTIMTLPLISKEEQRRLLIDWNQTHADFPLDRCCHQLFEAQVEQRPDAIAAVFESEQLTYGELNRRANQVAHHLQKAGVVPETVVGIYFERSLEMLIALLGVLKAGAAYLPLDASYPRDRLAFMLKDAEVKFLLSSAALLNSLPESSAKVFCLDSIDEESEENPASGAAAGTLAYVIYTSGSTGKPKGVMICHRSLSNHLLWRHSYFPLTFADRVLHKASFSFDDSVWELLEPLTAGACVVMAKPEGHFDSEYLVKMIAEQKINVACFVPSLLRAVLDEPGLHSCGSLRRVTTGGEALTLELQRRFFDRLSVDLHNGYGPTEATIAATFFTCDRNGDRSGVPIGRPIANTQVYILDPYLNPVPVGVPGELHIGGAGLARGYLNRPELTAEKFIANPFSEDPDARLYKTGDLARYLPDGNIEFLGRTDHQIKIRGFRIELGEIEAVLNQHPYVKACAVLSCDDTPGDKRLMAYIVPDENAPPASADLRDFLRRKLPDYMLPSAFIVLDQLPVTPSGKLDRRALPAPDYSGSEQAYVAPRTPTEKTLAAIWAEVLKLDKVGIHDSFFELGGHSLLATQVISRVKKTLDADIQLRALFESPTVAGLSALIVQSQAEALGDDELTQLLTEAQEQGSRE
ncbi:MAG: non-ribosomal peptide synthetase [Burkholderiales bacterium]